MIRCTEKRSEVLLAQDLKIPAISTHLNITFQVPLVASRASGLFSQFHTYLLSHRTAVCRTTGTAAARRCQRHTLSLEPNTTLLVVLIREHNGFGLDVNSRVIDKIKPRSIETTYRRVRRESVHHLR